MDGSESETWRNVPTGSAVPQTIVDAWLSRLDAYAAKPLTTLSPHGSETRPADGQDTATGGAAEGDAASPDREGESLLQLGGAGRGGSSRERPDIGVAIQFAERLIDELRAMRDQTRQEKPPDAHSAERLRTLETDRIQSIALRESLREVVLRPASAEQLGGLHAILNAWVRRPNDLLVMVKLSEQASVLVDIIASFREIRVKLEAAEPADPSPSGEEA